MEVDLDMDYGCLNEQVSATTSQSNGALLPGDTSMVSSFLSHDQVHEQQHFNQEQLVNCSARPEGSALSVRYPLHLACKIGDLNQLDHLLAQIPKDVSRCLQEDDIYGWSAIHWAAYYGKLACLRRLLQYCADMLQHCGNPQYTVNADLQTTRFRQTPVHVAAYGGSFTCLRWLIDSGFSTTAKDYLLETPVHKAARSGSFECLSMLLAHGVDASAVNGAGQSAADVAAVCGHMIAADYLRRACKLQADGLYPPFMPDDSAQVVASNNTTASSQLQSDLQHTDVFDNETPTVSENNGRPSRVVRKRLASGSCGTDQLWRVEAASIAGKRCKLQDSYLSIGQS